MSGEEHEGQDGQDRAFLAIAGDFEASQRRRAARRAEEEERRPRLVAWAEAAVLVVLAASLALAVVSGRYLKVVPPRAVWGIGFLVVCCLVWAWARARSARRREAPAREPGAWVRVIGLWAAAVCIALPINPTPSQLLGSGAPRSQTSAHSQLAPGGAPPAEEAGAAAAQSAGPGGGRPTSSPTAGTGSHAPAPDPSASAAGRAGTASSGPPLDVTTQTFYSTLRELSANGAAYEGREITVTGFVVAPQTAASQQGLPRLAATDSFALARMTIWCCAADAYALGFAVEAPAGTQVEPDQWVRVHGRLHSRGGKALALEADSVEAVDAPDQEFVFEER